MEEKPAANPGAGTLYALANDAMPNYFKIGLTTRTVPDRMRELYTTGVPLPFRCIAAKEVQDVETKERLAHQVFANHRVPYREFFHLPSPDPILSLFELIPGTPVNLPPPGQPAPARQGKAWTFQEQEHLLRRAQEGASHDAIAAEHERTPTAILARLTYIACNAIQQEGKSYEHAAELTRLTIPAIEEAIRRRNPPNKRAKHQHEAP